VQPKVVGFDATFSAPKSVSLLYAIGSPEVSDQVRSAHDAAVAAAFAVVRRRCELLATLRLARSSLALQSDRTGGRPGGLREHLVPTVSDMLV